LTLCYLRLTTLLVAFQLQDALIIMASSTNTDHAALKARLTEIVRARSFRCDRVFKLASGVESNLYFNMKPTMMHAEGAHLLSILMHDLLAPTKADYVGGLEMGAVPMVSSISIRSFEAGQPIGSFFVRKKPKEYGAALAVEGLTLDESMDGKRVVIVDDVATTGGSMLKALDAAEAAGAKIVGTAVIVDREEGANALMQDRGLELVSLFKAEDFLTPGHVPDGFERMPPKSE
jgi:orotate phosphoribosyltransferase